MLLGLIVGGLGVLFGLAVTIGHALDGQARDSAWQRIATSRRINQLKERELEEIELALQLREDDLHRRERRVDLREQVLLQREHTLEQLERELGDGEVGPSLPDVAS